jgi:septum formation inhibitor-activating ATPase MinD
MITPVRQATRAIGLLQSSKGRAKAELLLSKENLVLEDGF